MKPFDYSIEAALFFGKPLKGGKNALKFRRFEQASAAILYAVEELAARELSTCSLEVNDERYFSEAIRLLYERADFPLPRRFETHK